MSFPLSPYLPLINIFRLIIVVILLPREKWFEPNELSSNHIFKMPGVECGSISNPSYSLETAYVSTDFFTEFDFFTENDPTEGFVDYVDRPTAFLHGLISTYNGRAQLRSDWQEVVSAEQRGRKAVRLQSKKRWDSGLWVMHLHHMPSGCGTWPAFWTNGEDWPRGGEIDILEGANDEPYATSALHTSDGCDMSLIEGKGFDGIWTPNQSRNCYHLASPYNTGCASQARPSPSAPLSSITAPFGSAFNDRFGVGGAYVVMELNPSHHIQMWMFSPEELPEDIPRKLQRGAHKAKSFPNSSPPSSSSFPPSSSSSFPPSSSSSPSPSSSPSSSFLPSTASSSPNFTHSAVPLQTIRPDLWTKRPFAKFPLGLHCPGRSHFSAQQIILNQTFCGGWAGWNFSAECAAEAKQWSQGRPQPGPVPLTAMDQCVDHVRHNREYFLQSYWDISYLAVYQPQPADMVEGHASTEELLALDRQGLLQTMSVKGGAFSDQANLSGSSRTSSSRTSSSRTSSSRTSSSRSNGRRFTNAEAGGPSTERGASSTAVVAPKPQLVSTDCSVSRKEEVPHRYNNRWWALRHRRGHPSSSTQSAVLLDNSQSPCGTTSAGSKASVDNLQVEGHTAVALGPRKNSRNRVGLRGLTRQQ